MVSGNTFGRKVVSCRGTSETEKNYRGKKGVLMLRDVEFYLEGNQTTRKGF